MWKVWMHRCGIKLKDLSEYWNSHPHSLETQNLGDDFIDSKMFCVYKVPSAVVQGDFNYLINTHHKDANRVKINSTIPCPFEKRIFE